MEQHVHNGCRGPLSPAPSIQRAESESRGCPHIDRDDDRCQWRFSLRQLDQALSVCFGSYHGCAIFHRINGELGEAAEGHPCSCPRPADVAGVLPLNASRPCLRATGS